MQIVDFFSPLPSCEGYVFFIPIALTFFSLFCYLFIPLFLLLVELDGAYNI